MTFPLYFVYMVEVTGVGEISRNKVEINVNNILKQRVFSEVDKLGNKYYQRNPRKERDLGDWVVENDKGSEKRKLEISKGKEKQHLTINFEKQKMTGFDFILSDGKTIVSLQKNNEGKLIILRKDKKGKLITGSEDLSPREYLELTNFPFKFALDRKVNSIVDTVDPDKVIRYVLPVGATALTAVALGAHASMRDMNTYADNQFRESFSNRPALSQTVDKVVLSPVDDYISVSGVNEKKSPEKNLILLDPPKDRQDFYSAAIKANSIGSSNIEELRTIDILLTSGNSRLLESNMRAYFQEKNSSGLYHYRADSRGGSLTLVKPLEDALQIMRRNPNSQRSIFALLDGLHSFHNAEISAQSLITPEKIMGQAGYEGLTDNISAQQIWDSYWTIGAENYNQGSIKGFNLMFANVANGDLFVYPKDNVVGKVMSVGETIVVWTYDQTTGQVKIIKYDAKNFPNEEALGFRK